MFGEQLEQAGVRHPAVEDDDAAHAFLHRLQRGLDLRDHAARDRAVLDQRGDLVGRHLGDDLARLVLHPGDIGQQQQAIGLQRARDRARGGVAVDVEGLVVVHAGGDRGDHRDDAGRVEVADHLHVHLDRAADETELGIVRLAHHQVVVLARDADGAPALIVDRLHDALVDEAREDHLDHLDRGLVGDALAAHPVRLDAELGQHVVDHRPAAMHDDRVHPHLLHQHDVAGEFRHRLVVAHGIAAELHDDHGAGVALQVGKRLGEGPGGGDPVTVHGLLSHDLPPAKVAGSVTAKCRACQGHCQCRAGDYLRGETRRS
ncbi:hypothetical protein SDC9_42589 [bioreactor metagenome]|uniref:Uncharacterized protein n=1 Tax=bioreactor metagenome TaxID=1076179 RepID=A0A644VYB7_9ZZZZ